MFLRVAKMSDAGPLAGVTVCAVTSDNIELARSITDSNGIAAFSLPVLFPPKAPPVTLFVAHTPGGPSLSFAEANAYYTDIARGPDRVHNHVLIVTDRNLYRPGEEVKIKGILRDESLAGLAIPPTGAIHWRIIQGDGGKVIGEGTATLSPQGAFEASWPIPASAALGLCTLDCSLDGKPYPGSSTITIEEYRVPLFSARCGRRHRDRCHRPRPGFLSLLPRRPQLRGQRPLESRMDCRGRIRQ